MLRTPISSFDGGFQAIALRGGRLEATLEGEFFALHGTKDAPECVTPADALMPEACFISIERTIPFTLRLDVELRD